MKTRVRLIEYSGWRDKATGKWINQFGFAVVSHRGIEKIKYRRMTAKRGSKTFEVMESIQSRFSQLAYRGQKYAPPMLELFAARKAAYEGKAS